MKGNIKKVKVNSGSLRSISNKNTFKSHNHNMEIVIEGLDDMNEVQELVTATKEVATGKETPAFAKEKTANNGMKKNINLVGLCCANCAAKIEKEANKLTGVKEAVVDFASQRLIVEVEDSHSVSNLVNSVTEIVKRIEPNVKVVYEEERKAKAKDQGAEEDGKSQLLRIGTGAAAFFTAVIFNLPQWAELTFYLISYVLVGGEVVLRAVKNISRGEVFDENFLMGLATIGAFSIGEFAEGVAVMLFYQIGELFQDYAINRSRKSIASLMDIRPDFANLVIGNEVKKVSPEEVNVGDTIVVKPGEKLPLDGIIIEGRSMIDTSALTGESLPREVQKGDEVLSGVINKNGLLTIRVTKIFGDSTVAKILDLVQNASSKKSPTENFITKFARYYTPAVVLCAVALAFLPPLFIPGASFSQWIYRALVFLVVSCPCALVISIPLSFFGGIGGASRNGILVKGGNYLEALNNVEIVVFDKTGTLTKGAFIVTEIKPVGEFSKEQLLEYAAYAESYSNHPIAASIVKAYGKNINKQEIENYNEVMGQGIKVKVRGKDLLAGNIRLMSSEGISYAQYDSVGTTVHIAIDKIYAGYLVISDDIKEDSAQAINELKKIGIKKTVMLTGDSKAIGIKVGKDLGLDEIYTELLPDKKVYRMEKLSGEKSPKGKLVFVGDGINDAPVLARADIGIAMGGVGSDAAIEAADIVIMTDEPTKVAAAIKIAKKTKNIVMQNIVFALGVKFLILLFGALGFATMWEAVFGDVGVALIAVLNAMRAIKVEN